MIYHGYRALGLENDVLRVVVTPDAGGKIVSLYDRRAEREWLVTPEQSNAFRAWPYGAEYNPNQCGGWDEMIPTILACSYPGEGVYEGRSMPDHGEAWTLPWKALESGESQIVLELIGQALRYRMQRSLSLERDILCLAYTLENQADAPLVYLWAAHPQFACDPGATIVLPEQTTQVINALPIEWGAEFGQPGTRNPWPAFELASGSVRQDRVSGPEKHRGRKFYLPPDRPIAWGELRQPTGESLRMSWDEGFAPYCGVWIDEGFLNKVSDVAFEPTTGYYDSLAAAWTNGRCSVLAPRAMVAWEMQVQLR